MKHADFIRWITLEPYAPNEEVLVISGYTAEEVKEAIRKHFTTHFKLDSIHKIRDTMKAMNVYLDFCKELETWINNCKNNTGPNDGFFANHKTDNIESYVIVLRKELDRDKYRDVITISHEVLHLCQAFLPRFLNRDVEHEAEAYFHKRITEQILET